MRVLLVQSPLGGREPLVYPLGLACLLPSLKEHEVRVFDANLSDDPFAELAGILDEFRPEAVGVSLRNMDSPNNREVVSYYEPFKRMIAEMKRKSDAAIIVGGAGFSLFAELIMADEPGIDFGVFLEGETAFAELLNNLKTPEKAPSVYYRSRDGVAFTGRGARPEKVSSPDMSAFPLAPYRDVAQPEAVGVESKRGCALSCAYCPYGFLNGREYRFKDPAKVAEEVAELAEQGVPRFTFIDSVFNIPRDQAEEVCRELIARGNILPWSAWFNEREMDRAFVDLAYQAGCRNVILSPDGFSDDALRRLGKIITVEDIRRVSELLADACDRLEGLRVSWSFFRNPPGQTLLSFIKLGVFCVRAKLRMGGRTSFFFSRLRIEPHTGISKTAKAEGVIRDERDLLRPVFYSQKRTAYLEWIFDLLMKLKGGG